MRALIAALALVTVTACGPSTTSASAGPVPSTLRVSGSGGGAITLTSNTAASVSAIPFPLADVWRVIPVAYDSVGLAVSVVDPATHTVTNGGTKLRRQLGGVSLSRYIDCGGTQIGSSADSYDVILTVQTQIRSDGTAASSVLTTVDAVGKSIAFAGDYSRCSSTGKLEERLAAVINAKLHR